MEKSFQQGNILFQNIFKWLFINYDFYIDQQLIKYIVYLIWINKNVTSIYTYKKNLWKYILNVLYFFTFL
jgi:hypothetical protein